MTENGVSAKKSNVAGNWYAATRVVRPPARVLASDLDVDVCIIGAGLTGLTIAYELTRAGWSVAVIDAGEIGASATQRRMGVVTPGFSLADDRIVDRVGVDHARALWALSGEGVAQVRRTIADCAMAGVTLAEGRLVLCPGGTGEAERVAARLRDQFAVEVEVWSADRRGRPFRARQPVRRSCFRRPSPSTRAITRRRSRRRWRPRAAACLRIHGRCRSTATACASACKRPAAAFAPPRSCSQPAPMERCCIRCSGAPS